MKEKTKKRLRWMWEGLGILIFLIVSIAALVHL